MRRPLATLEEAAEYLRVPPTTLYQWRTKGTGPKSSKVGRYVRYRWEDIEKYLDETQAAIQ